MVQQCRPGQRLPGVGALARQFQAGTTTVRLVLAQFGQEGLVESRNRSGTYVAQRTGPAPIGILSVMDVFPPEGSRYFQFLMGEVRRELEERGLPARMYVGDYRPWELPVEQPYQLGIRPPASFLADLRAGRLAGVVAVDTGESPAWLPEFVHGPTPMVGMGFFSQMPSFIRMANPTAMAVKHLVEQGRRRLAIMCWRSLHPRERQDLIDRTVFTDAVRQHGLTVEPAWINDDFNPARRNAGANALRELWGSRREKFDGLVIADDVLARTALPALAQMNLSPGRLSIVCRANHGDQRLAPWPIDWFTTDFRPLAKALVRQLLDRSAQPTLPDGLIVPCVDFIESSIDSEAGFKSQVAMDVPSSTQAYLSS
ncbi:MAG: substrate-binding domain-containing protein [Phycisphaeraceae bacterium]|nr:substrate-binding domain-containing protein [Phycisphaeraceae bacterium]